VSIRNLEEMKSSFFLNSKKGTAAKYVGLAGLFLLLVGILHNSTNCTPTESAIDVREMDDVHEVENHPFIAGRGHVISLSAKQFSYESPFTDLEKASSHKNVFAKIPSSVFPLPSSDMVNMWNTLQPFAHEYVSHEENNMFNFCDSAILYAFMRHTKPQRVIEVGSGFSTRIVKRALDKNYQDSGARVKHLCVEPYRAEVLKDMEIDVIIKPVQEVELEIFDQLESGDVLFLDNSHVVKPYGDVIYEFLWILPRLKPGVHVHIHDIFLPNDYPAPWMINEFRPYTEQYLLAAFLHNNNAWSISFMNNGIMQVIADENGVLVSSYSDICHQGFGGSMYITKRS